MRIVINGWFTEQPATGSGQYLDALLAWLPRVGEEHEFIVVTPGIKKPAHQQTADRPILSDASRLTLRVSRFTSYASRFAPNLAKLWFEQIAFPWACLRLRADVAFVPYWAAPWWSPCPAVVTVHDLIPLLLPAYRGGLLQRAYTALVSRTARWAAAVITDSEASKADIVARLGIAADRVHAIHLAADPRYSRPVSPAEMARVRAKYGLPDEPFLLYVGGFDMRKNVLRMIEAYGRMLDRLIADRQRASAPSPQLPALVVAGKLPAADTPFAPDPRPVVARLGLTDRVHFIGWVDEADKPALYALALGSVFVSEYEGFGLPVVEGMGGAALSLPDNEHG